MAKALAPIIVKTSFYLPSKINNSKNVANLNYISNKPETVKEQIQEQDNSASIHLEYSATREGSHGVLTAENNIANIQELREELKNSESIVYRIIVSLREDEAIRIDHTKLENWQDTIRKSMPVIGEKMGITESNLKWAAAYHAKEGHPHAHILMWEKNPQRSIGKLSKGEMGKIKQEFTRNIYAQEREKMYLERNYLRDILRRSGRAEMLQARKDLQTERIFVQKDLGKQEKITPVLTQEQEQELAAKLQSLAQNMPKTGRMALRFMPEGVKEEAKNIADYILKQPQYKQSAERFCKIQKDLASHYTADPQKINDAGDKAYADIKERVAQDVLKVAGNINFTQKIKGQQNLASARSCFKAAWQSIEKERTKAEAQVKIINLKEDKKLERKKQNLEKGEERER